MDVKVGYVLLDRDPRRVGREVKVLEVDENTVTIQTIKTVGGVSVADGVISTVSKSRLGKSFSVKSFPHENSLPDDVIVKGEGNTSSLNDSNIEEDLIGKVVEKIVERAEPGNKIVLDRLTALESRMNSLEYGRTDYYWKPNVYCDTNSYNTGGSDTNNLKSFTGSVVTNYPSIDEVLEKILPETETEEFEYMWDRLLSEDRNPHETIVRLVYNLLTT